MVQTFLFTAVIFLLFFGLFASGVLLSTPVLQSVNSTQSNVSVTSIGTSGINVPSCTGSVVDQIPVLGQGSCMAAYLGFMFSIAATKTDIIYVGFILAGISAVLVYGAIRLIRGGG